MYIMKNIKTKWCKLLAQLQLWTMVVLLLLARNNLFSTVTVAIVVGAYAIQVAATIVFRDKLSFNRTRIVAALLLGLSVTILFILSTLQKVGLEAWNWLGMGTLIVYYFSISQREETIVSKDLLEMVLFYSMMELFIVSL